MGTRILEGRYELSQELGRGSTGTVWDACDLASGNRVAVKVLRAGLLTSPRAFNRFLREAESARRLRHPHSVEVLAHGLGDDGSGYLVMERLQGRTLAARLREHGPLGQPQSIHIVAQILDAVGAAHRLQIVHRDLKPSNIMLIERDGDPDFVKVCDFGLAKVMEADRPDTPEDSIPGLAVPSIAAEQGEICGTPEYMAPEQARGEAIDARADLYAIAVILYHVLVGQLPFSGRSPLAVISQHLATAPPRPSTLRPDLGIFPPLERLILRALAKDKAERPSSAEVFRADLLQIARDYARRARSAATGPSGASSSDRPTLVLGLRNTSLRRSSAAALGLLAVSGGVALGLDDHGPASAPARTSSAAVPPGPALPLQAPGAAAASRELVSAPSPDPSRREVATMAEASASGKARVRAQPARRAARVPRSALPDAQELLAQGRVVEACALAQAEAARHPETPSPWRFLGQCYMRLGDREQAVAYYSRYLALSPSGADAVFVREMIKEDVP